MPAPAIRIKVGAAMDSSVDRVFATIEARARRAQQVLSTGWKSSGRDAAKGIAEVETAWTRAGNNMGRTTRKIQDESSRAFREIGRVAEREMNRAARASFNAQQRAGRQFAERTSHRATRFLTPNAPMGSYAARAAGDIVRGAGVDLSMGNAIQRNVALDQAAIGLANQERIATGGTTAGAGHYEEIARKTSGELGVAPDQVIEMMRALSGKTGEFGQLAEMVKRLAPAAVASGTSFQNMGEAAGFFYNQVKHLPNALELTQEGMRAIIGQTAVGSVEMPAFATQMGRIAANAPKFKGTREHVIAQSAALAQLAIESGGATSAADAGRSVSAFADTFGKGARINAFKKHGVELFTDPGTGPGKNTQLRDQFEIAKDAIVSTKGNVPMLAEMFASTLGRKPVTALASKYTDAGGGEAGVRAMDAAIKKYMGTTLTAAAQQANVADHLNSTTGKVARFQTALDGVAKKAGDRLLPALEKLEPSILRLASVIGDVATWTVENPKQAIGLAISASIARAGIESTLRAGIERMILGANGGGLPGGRAGTVGATVSQLGGALTIASLAVATVTAGKLVIDEYFGAKDAEGQRDSTEKGLRSEQAAGEAEGRLRSGDVAGAKKAAERAIAISKDAKIDTAPGTGFSFLRAAADELLGSGKGLPIPYFAPEGIREATGTTDKALVEAQQDRARVEEAHNRALGKNTARANDILERIANRLDGGIALKSPNEGRGSQQ